jgi:hypothetical protein
MIGLLTWTSTSTKEDMISVSRVVSLSGSLLSKCRDSWCNLFAAAPLGLWGAASFVSGQSDYALLLDLLCKLKQFSLLCQDCQYLESLFCAHYLLTIAANIINYI